MKLHNYLLKYKNIQEDITLCYRPSNQGVGSSWGDRCQFLSPEYSRTKKYNHRVTLDKEIVIEFDEEKPEDNEKAINIVCKRLKKDDIKYSLWYSGGKSTHCHFFVDTKKASNLRLLKSVIMRHYCEGLEFKPDLQLAGKHLIRAEFGINEKTGKYKTKLYQSKEYPILNTIKQEVWDKYIKEMNWLLKASMTRSTNDLADSEYIKKLLDTTYFNDKLKDGRNRIIFVLANVLKTKYEKKELINLLQQWYKYCGGKKMSDNQIAYVVYKAYKTDQSPGLKYILQLLKELGVEE